jgi:tetratricopeptide (TPR) repeat protein
MKEPNNIQVSRRIGWLACGVLAMALVVGGLKPAREAVGKAIGVRSLLQEEMRLPDEVAANPFICLREAENEGGVDEEQLNDAYLEGVSLCLRGQREAGLVAFKEAEDEGGARVQYGVGLAGEDIQASLEEQRKAGLSNEELANVLVKLSSQEGIDPFGVRRGLAEVAGNDARTWRMWIQGYSKLATEGKWETALAWMEEGLATAPAAYRGSLRMREGRIYQTRSEGRDYQAAVRDYQQALEEGGWVYTSDEAATHQYLGESYRALKEVYSPEQALEQFEKALELQPGSYGALLNIGRVYLSDLKDDGRAEDYFKQAIASNEQSPYAYYYLGEVWRVRGDNQKAMAWYETALEKQADFQPAIDRIATLEGK